MVRLIGPDANSRLAYATVGGVLASAAGRPAVVYANPTGSTLADIRQYNGTSTVGPPITNSTVTVDSDSLIPLFWYPDNVDVVYIEVDGGTRTPADADYNARIDNVSGYVNSPMMSTGIISGGALTPNAGNPQAVDIAPLVGYVVDYATNDASPTVTRVELTTTLTVALNAGSLSRVRSWLLMDSTGSVIQQETRPSLTQRRTHLQLGTILYNAAVGAVAIAQEVPIIQPQFVNQFYDLLYALGSFSVTGNIIAPAGANLSFSKTAGTMFAPGLNYSTSKINPHIVDSPAQSTVAIYHITRSSLTLPVNSTTILDVANYDLNGVITPIGGGTNSSTIFRVWLIPFETVGTQIGVQYGQTVYSSLSNAVNAIGTTNYIANPSIAAVATLIGHIAVTRTATNLSDPTQASVIPSRAKFPRP